MRIPIEKEKYPNSRKGEKKKMSGGRAKRKETKIAEASNFKQVSSSASNSPLYIFFLRASPSSSCPLLRSVRADAKIKRKGRKVVEKRSSLYQSKKKKKKAREKEKTESGKRKGR